MTKILHQLGHNGKRNIDSYISDGIGDGFIINAYNHSYESLDKSISGYKKDQFILNSMLDLQFYASKDTKGGKAKTYPMHPTNFISGATNVIEENAIIKGIDLQQKIGFKKIIVPLIYDGKSSVEIIGQIKMAKRYLQANRVEGIEYYMTLVFGSQEQTSVFNLDYIESLLIECTNPNKIFDGYYIICDSQPSYRRKVSDNPMYYLNLSRIFATLKLQGLKTVFGFANFDSLVFMTCCDIDYVTLGSYDNLRMFTIQRFNEEKGGGPSKGWYFSEKLLNFVKAQKLDEFRAYGILDQINNDGNIYSDIILEKTYPRNVHKPEVHKNYFVAINKMINELNSMVTIDDKIHYVLGKIDNSLKLYESLYQNKGIILDYESGSDHLSEWKSFLHKKRVEINKTL